MSVCNHTEGEGHDCAWVDFRDGLIPYADAMARKEIACLNPEDPVLAYGAAFLRNMETLAKSGLPPEFIETTLPQGAVA